jgi:hypothetical protein
MLDHFYSPLVSVEVLQCVQNAFIAKHVPIASENMLIVEKINPANQLGPCSQEAIAK